MKQLGFLVVIMSLLLNGCIWTTPQGTKSILPQFTANLMAEERSGLQEAFVIKGNQNQIDLGIDVLKAKKALKKSWPVFAATAKAQPGKTLGVVVLDTVILAAEGTAAVVGGREIYLGVKSLLGKKDKKTTIINEAKQSGESGALENASEKDITTLATDRGISITITASKDIDIDIQNPAPPAE